MESPKTASDVNNYDFCDIPGLNGLKDSRRSKASSSLIGPVDWSTTRKFTYVTQAPFPNTSKMKRKLTADTQYYINHKTTSKSFGPVRRDS